MTRQEALENALRAYSVYYDIIREDGTPWAARADFRAHDEQYFLLKSNKMNEIDAFEYVYFAEQESFSLEEVQKLDELAWETAMARVQPGPNHRSSDVTMVLIADTFDPEVLKFVKKLRRYKSYKWTFHGWSHYRVVALEASSGVLVFNRMGEDLKKLFRNIKKV